MKICPWAIKNLLSSVTSIQFVIFHCL